MHMHFTPTRRPLKLFLLSDESVLGLGVMDVFRFVPIFESFEGRSN